MNKYLIKQKVKDIPRITLEKNRDKMVGDDFTFCLKFWGKTMPFVAKSSPIIEIYEII